MVQDSTASVLTIGRISGNPRKHAGRLSALADYLVPRMADTGITESRILLKPDHVDILSAAQQGEIDLISETVFTASLLEQRSGMEIILLEWKKSIREYSTAIIVRKDSDIRTLEDLRGRRISFEDPGSTSGFFLPYAEMMDAGLEMAPASARNPAEGAVRYSFANSEINVVGSVIRKRTDAGAISDSDLDDPEVMTARFKPQLRVLHVTQSVPRSVVLVRRSMDPERKRAIRDILLQMHESDEGKGVLSRYFKVTRFEEIDAGAQAALDWVGDAVRTRHAR